jgi:hypothetical protein
VSTPTSACLSRINRFPSRYDHETRSDQGRRQDRKAYMTQVRQMRPFSEDA